MNYCKQVKYCGNSVEIFPFLVFNDYDYDVYFFKSQHEINFTPAHLNKQEAVKASNSPRDRKDGIRMAKKIFEGRQLFSNNDIFLGGMHSIGLMSGEEAYFYS